MQDRHPNIRLWPLKQDILQKSYTLLLNPADQNYHKQIALLAGDTSSHVRYHALWHIEKFVPHQERPRYHYLFEKALLDKKEALKKFAQAYIKKYL
jgi:hypothetical protein